MIRLAAQEATLPGANLEEQFQFALDCGFDGIELSGKGDGVFGARAEELRRARDAGVQMCSAVMHTPTFLGSFEPAARATASSPSWWNKRGAPTGANTIGAGSVAPNSSVVVSMRATSQSTRGMSSTSSKPARLRRSVYSSSPPPSR